ncbi:alpha/beta hydrolase [candidate division KSB1 bacterium]|nr:alpha/beta hydrolase [candidate division KSB1 bacterium]
MTAITKTLTLDKNLNLSYWKRPSDSGDTIVFIHGFGSAKEHFRYALDSQSLEKYTLVAVDLVGFGQSRGPEEFDYTMKNQATLVIELLDNLKTGNFYLCGHSMGGLVAMNIAELIPNQVLSLIDLEGNLTPEDCFISGMVAGSSLKVFAEKGKPKLVKDFRDAGIKEQSMKEYADTFGAASTVALYKSAGHTVKDSSTLLVERLSRIRNVCYIYGEKNRGLYPGEKLLKAAGVPIFYIDDAGHSMATENPEQLYSVIRSFIDGLFLT